MRQREILRSVEAGSKMVQSEVIGFGGKQKSSGKRKLPEQRQIIYKSLESRQQAQRGIFSLSLKALREEKRRKGMSNT